MDTQLLELIRERSDAGQKKGQIRKTLLGMGYTATVVDEHLKLAGAKADRRWLWYTAGGIAVALVVILLMLQREEPPPPTEVMSENESLAILATAVETGDATLCDTITRQDIQDRCKIRLLPPECGVECQDLARINKAVALQNEEVCVGIIDEARRETCVGLIGGEV